MRRAVDSGPSVLMVVPAFPKLSETFIVSKFLGLLERGFDVRVLCGRSDPAEWAQFPELASRPELRRRVIRSWPTRPRWLAAALGPIAIPRCAWRNVRGFQRALMYGRARFGPGVLGRLYLDAGAIEAKPDLIHFEFGTQALGRTWLGEALGCKLVVSFRGFDLNLSGLDRDDYYREVWDEADALHFLGENLRQQARRLGCPPDLPNVLIPPAVDTEFFTPVDAKSGAEDVAGSPNRPLRILGVGRLDWRKGYDDAMMTVRCLLDRGICCEYRIIGDGSYREAVAYARHQLGLTERIHLLGAQSREVVRKQFVWADVLLHAAVSEGFCNVVVEAQSMALPVAATDAGGLPENVDDGVTGFVVPRRDPDAMADRLALLAEGPDLRRTMGEAARRRAVDRFDLSRQIDAFAAFYHQVLDKAPRRGPTPGRSRAGEQFAESRR